VDLSTIRIDLTSKDGREVVENLLRAADAPGALLGRAKNGSAALVFRSVRPHDATPYVRGADHHQRVFELATKDGATRVKISTDAAAPFDGYKWDRDIPQHELPALTQSAANIGTRVIEAAFKLGLTWAEIVDRDLADEERAAKLRADVAAGRVKIKTEAEIAADAEARHDAEVVKANEGREYEWSDGPHAQVILSARGRHALRQRKQTALA
jgi:hypothetical protein